MIEGMNCSSQMNSAQTIYTIFFAIYFAVTIGSTNRLDLFDTTAMFYGGKYPKSWMRFGVSLLIMNILPLGYFWYVMQGLEKITGNEGYQNFGFLLIIFLQSIVGFGFYRILFGILMCKEKDNKEFFFYSKRQYVENQNLVHVPIEDNLRSRINNSN